MTILRAKGQKKQNIYREERRHGGEVKSAVEKRGSALVKFCICTPARPGAASCSMFALSAAFAARITQQRAAILQNPGLLSVNAPEHAVVTFLLFLIIHAWHWDVDPTSSRM